MHVYVIEQHKVLCMISELECVLNLKKKVQPLYNMPHFIVFLSIIWPCHGSQTG